MQLVDSRIGPTQDDTMMMEWMLSENIPFVLVGTKADKLKKSERDAFLTEMRESYLNGTSIPVLLFSSQTREGKEALWGHLTHALTR